MPLVVWSDKLSVGVKSLDDQHAVLFKYINELHAAMMRGQARNMVGDLLEKLLDYTRKHFAEEEAMLAKSSYPGLLQHKVLHRGLTQQVEDYIALHKAGDLMVGSQVSKFLSEWLTTHILESDQEYGHWLEQQRLQKH